MNRRAVLSGLLAMLACTQAAATPYEPPSYTDHCLWWFKPADINSLGQIVGYDSYFDRVELGGWYDDTWISIPELDSASAVNDSGQVVGTAFVGAANHAMSWKDGIATDLGTLGGEYAEATDVNEAGQIVGNAFFYVWKRCDPEDEQDTRITYSRGFLYTPGVGTTLLPTLGGLSSHADAINNAGQVAGWAELPWREECSPGSRHAVMWQGGGITDLGTLGGSYSEAEDINDAGWVVGEAYTTSSGSRPFLWMPETGMVDLGELEGVDVVLGRATGINRSGQVVGYEADVGSHSSCAHGFLYMPQLGMMPLDGGNPAAIDDGGRIVSNCFGDMHLLMPNRWLMLYYMSSCASGPSDPSLEWVIEAKFHAIAQYADNPNYDAWILWDSSNKEDRVYHVKAGTDWNGGYTEHVDYWTATDIGLPGTEMDTGDVATLKAFADFVVPRAETEHCALVIMGHGSGVHPTVVGGASSAELEKYARGGVVCFDGNGSYLSVRELGEGTFHLHCCSHDAYEILHLDSCLMQMAEICCSTPWCEYVIGSQNLGWYTGPSWEYDYLIRMGRNTTASELAVSMASAYFDHSAVLGSTVSVWNTWLHQGGGRLLYNIDALAVALIDNMPTVRSEIAVARSNAQKFAYFNTCFTANQDNIFLDLRDLCIWINSTIDNAEINAAADAVIDALSPDGPYIVREFHRDRCPFYLDGCTDGCMTFAGANGVSVFFPECTTPGGTGVYYNYVNVSATPSNLSFCARTHWDDFLRAYLEFKVLRVTATAAVGANIACTPDKTGDGAGITPFGRMYENGTVVTLTAPETVMGNTFAKWLLDGAPYSGSRTIEVTMDSDKTVTAAYQPGEPDRYRPIQQFSDFSFPESICCGPDGDIYVADTGNCRVQKLTPDGSRLAMWGQRGSGNGQFQWPPGITSDPLGAIYVTDPHRVQKFTPDGTFLASWGSLGTAPGQFRYPYGICSDPSGSIYVVDNDNSRVQKFTSGGAFLTKWGSYGYDEGQFDYPFGICSDQSGYVYVADSDNCRIQKFTSEGVFVSAWGEWGTEPGLFDTPSGVCCDPLGDIYVADSGNDRIQKLAADGRLLATWGSRGTGPDQFDWPEGVCSDLVGDIYVADSGNNRVLKFTTRPAVFIEQSVTQPDPTSQTTINFAVSFTEPVWGLTSEEIVLGGTAGPTTAVVTGEGMIFNVAVSGMTSSGTVSAVIPAGAACDVAGNWNFASSSSDNTVTYVHGDTTVSQAKQLPDAYECGVASAVVTALFSTYLYVEEPDRSSGIRVEASDLPPDLAIGDVVCVWGILARTADGEHCLTAARVAEPSPPVNMGGVSPIALTNAAVGGSDYCYNPSTGAGQEGVLGWVFTLNEQGQPVLIWDKVLDLNNIGLLVTIYGKFTKTSDTTFTLDDGSRVTLKCVVPSGVTLDPSWNYVVVTGISSCEKIGQELHRLIRVRAQADITPY